MLTMLFLVLVMLTETSFGAADLADDADQNVFGACCTGSPKNRMNENFEK